LSCCTVATALGQAIRGVVVDSAHGTPIANARVDLVGPMLSATTDARGRFSIPHVSLGTYRVETRTPELEALGASSQSTLAFTNPNATYQIRVPDATQLISSLCAGRPLSSGETAIVGRVYSRGDTLPVAGARVFAEWTVADSAAKGSAPARIARKLEGKASRDGSFRLCGTPSNTTVTVTALTASASSDPKPLFASSRIVRADLIVNRVVSTTAKLTGRVLVDPTKAPIEGAEIYFPELSKVGRSVATGEFQLADIPAGPQHIVVRHIGYGVLDTTLTFQPNTVVDHQIFLSRVNLLDSVIVRDRLRAGELADFDTNRRLGLGHFMDRVELATMPDAKLSRVVAQWPGMGLVFGSGGRVWIAARRRPPPACTGSSCYAANGWYVPDVSEAMLGVKVACYSQIYINGTLMNRGNPTPPFEVDELYTEQIEALEWYAGPSETPGRYADRNSGCGVLVVHTRRSR
jgi:hypothetical protein